jgi:quinohemoprotein amine dehydrogenase
MSLGKLGVFALVIAGICSAQEGIRIDDPLAIRKCGGCHQRDANTGMMTRLSYIRTSPEVWDQAIKRMVRLNGLTVTPDEARSLLRFFSSNNGLAPEEMKPAFWEPEHRTWGYQGDYVPNPVLQKTCNTCHSIGRVLAQRRTKSDYEKLVAMHIGMFPSAQNALRPSRSKPTPVAEAPARINTAPNGGPALEQPRGAAAGDAKQPADLAIDWLAANQPLITPEWVSWKAAMRAPKLAGTWLVSAYQPGKGKVYGTMKIVATTDDTFTTTTELTYASGATVKMTGKSLVYTGYNWRGRSTSGTAATPLVSSATPVEFREAMMMSRDGNTLEGRWFWSTYGELGMDVILTRTGAAPVLAGTDVSALQSPSTQQVKIFGANLATALKPSDVDFGPGVTVKRVVSSTPTMATVEVEVAKGLPVGMRDISVGSATSVEALAVYDQIGYIEITPDANISRLGGIRYPKEYAQFDVTAWAAGPDGKMQTDDDVDLGPVTAGWSLEEFLTTPEDDDIKFVGKVDDTGLFTPAVEGINPERKKQDVNFPVNNFGDVWVAATYRTPAGKEYKARSYLVVTVPNYSIYDQPEVGQ